MYIPSWLRESPDADLPSSTLIRNEELAGSRAMTRAKNYGFANPEALPAWITANTFVLVKLLPPEDRPAFRLLLLQYRARSIRDLRDAINEKIRTNSRPSVSLILQILYLFRGECMMNEREAAQAHALVMPWIDQAGVESSMAGHLMVVAMFSDTEMACKSLNPTCLDYKCWLANRLNPFWNYSETVVPEVPPKLSKNLHPSLTNEHEVVHGAMLRLRRCLYIRDTLGPRKMHPSESQGTGDLMYLWIATKTLHDIGSLVNHAVEMIESIQNEQWEQRLDVLIHAAISLTALYSMRKYLHEANCCGFDLRNAPLLIPKLEEILRRVSATASKQQMEEHREVLFWMYFTGSWHGQKLRQWRRRYRNSYLSGLCMEAPDDFNPAWFDVQLSKQAQKLGVTRWADAKLLISRFCFSDIIRPHPLDWFEEKVEEWI